MQIKPTEKRSIFKDRQKLHPSYTPPELLHREKQIRMLDHIFKPPLKNPEKQVMKIIQIIGPTGSGKTSTLQYFSHSLRKASQETPTRLLTVHINCKTEAKTQRNLYKKIHNKTLGKTTRDYPPEDYLTQLVNHLAETGQHLLLVLDDIDQLIQKTKKENPKSDIAYDLTRLNEVNLGQPTQITGVIFIAKNHSFKKHLDLSEKSSLGHQVIQMPSYTKKELHDILEARNREAFHPDVVPQKVLRYVADLASGRQESPGDCRYALDLLLSAGERALYSTADKVTLEHVRHAYTMTEWGVSDSDILHLGIHGVLTLKAAAEALESHQKAYVPVKEVHDYYVVSCANRELKPFSYNKVRELVKELDSIGALDQEHGKGVGISRGTLSDVKQGLKALEKN